MKFIKIIFFFIIQIVLANASDEGIANAPSTFINYKTPAPINIEDYPKISIKIDGENKSLSCALDSKSKIYICKNGNNPILVKHSFMGFFSIGRDESGSPKSLLVTSVEAANKTLFEIPKMGFYGGGESTQTYLNSTKDLNQDYSKKVSLVEQFFMDINNGPDGSKVVHILQGSKEFTRIAKSYINEMKVFQATYNKIRKDNVYRVELTDGSKIKCERGESLPLTPEEITYEKKSGLFIQCSSFTCEDVVKNGKKLKALLLFDSNPGGMTIGTLHLYDNSGIGPEAVIKNIASDLSPTPLLDNSFFINHPNEGGLYGNLDFKNILPQDIRQNKNNISLYKDPNFIQLINYEKSICSKAGLIDDFINAKNKLIAKLADAELVQYIELLGNGTLRSNFVNPNEASKLGCRYNGIYLNSDAAKNLDKIDKNLFPDKHIEQTISLEKANSLFKEAIEMKDIAWKYKQDGCYARAHLMAKRFEAEGVRVDKVWIKGDLYIPESKPLIQWSFHVAPIVYVKDTNGNIQKMVIDPSLFERPVSVEEWDKNISKSTIRGSVVTGFPFPENSAFMERSSISFSSSAPYLPNEEPGLSEKEKIKMANETMKKYKQLEDK